MSRKPFCEACGAKVEWHVTKIGAEMPLDPGPHPEGNFYFGPGPRLFKGSRGLKPKMYRCHWATCAKKGQAPRRAAFACDRNGCEVEGFHRHCYRCGGTDHFASDCEGDES